MHDEMIVTYDGFGFWERAHGYPLAYAWKEM
jgi:hypothetical protein